MNRSALVIKMLNVLYGRNTPISREELAKRLETNPRNISEFKKELEIAGYTIESVRGKYGGYQLLEEGIFPSLTLENREKSSINEALTFLKGQSNFVFFKDFEEAMEKVKAKTKNRDLSNDTVYMSATRKGLDKVENEMLNDFILAKEKMREVCFTYLSNTSKVFDKRRVKPYEIIVNNDGIYVLAEDMSIQKKHLFKFFKIINERMHNVIVQEKTFLRDTQFRVSEHTGKNALMKDMHEVEVEIHGLQARLINEMEIENTLSKKYEEDVLNISFMMEGKIRLQQFILSLGSACKIIRPNSLREEIKEELLKSLRNY